MKSLENQGFSFFLSYDMIESVTVFLKGTVGKTTKIRSGKNESSDCCNGQ